MLLNCGVENPLDFKEIQPVHPKGNQPWIFIGRTDAETEVPVLWPPDVKSQLIEKDSDAGKDWRQEEKGTTEDEMVGWHHRLSGQEFEQTPGNGEEQGSLVCCCSWGLKELDLTVTEQQMHQFKRDKLRKNWWKGNGQLTRGTQAINYVKSDQHHGWNCKLEE